MLILEKLDFLINYLLEENRNIAEEKMPTDKEDKKRLWRSLCNIRDAMPISEEYLKIEKECLQEELSKKNITKVEDINPISITINETELVPVCPVCGERMEVNVRIDANFVQDDNWYKLDNKYGELLDNTKDKNVVLLELGVGFNTPGIIRFPFEQMTYQNPNWKLIRINKDNCDTFLDIEDKSILFQNDINEIVDMLKS